jgi:acetoin utilization deacetylase AcuC-like enzyme
VFNSILAPVLQSFQPDLILVSAGFDAHRSDPLGGMGLSEDGYDQLLQIVMHMAAEFCAGRVALTLEGGYNLGALAESVGRVLTTLSSYDPEKAEPPLPPAAETLHPRTVKMLSDVADVFRPYWSSLSQQ